jgi:hypothetical protein
MTLASTSHAKAGVKSPQGNVGGKTMDVERLNALDYDEIMLVSRSSNLNQWVPLIRGVRVSPENDYTSINAMEMGGSYSDIKLVWKSGGLSPVCETLDRHVRNIVHSTSMQSKPLFDGLDNTVWRSADIFDTDHAYIPETVERRNRGLAKFKIKVGTTQLDESPVHVTLAGKNEGTDEWVTLHQSSRDKPWTSGEERLYDLGDTVALHGAFPEYRFSFRSAKDRVSIAEIRLYEYVHGSSPSRGWPTCNDNRWSSFWWYKKDTTWSAYEDDVLKYLYGHCGK